MTELYHHDSFKFYTMKKNILFSIVLSFILSSLSFSQQAKIAAADKQYDRFAFIDAIKIYEKVAEKGHKSVDLFQKLGNAYYFNAEFEKANHWYQELFALNTQLEPEYYFRYSETLKSVGDYKKANEMLDQFSTKSATDSRAKLYNDQKDYLQIIKENSGRYTIEELGINSEFSDYGASFSGNNLVFASTRQTNKPVKRVQKWNNQAFTSLYSSKVNGDGNLDTPELFSSDTDSKFNESTPVFTNDGKTMYFTRNNYNNGKKGKDSEKIILLKLYKATLVNGKFSNVTELPFNSDQYSTAHPALSPDEKSLYFASDMPGTLGKSDIYKVAINADGTFGKPENLGKNINTEGKETFPFLSNDGELYFSSNGHPGLGGLDVFVSKIQKDNVFGEVKNVGEPVNSPDDDFAFLIDTKSKIGFFSSNREGGKGFDDIYKFVETKKLECEQLLAGTTTDAETAEVLENVKVTLLNEKMQILKEIYSDNLGNYSFEEIECGKVYYLRAEKKDFVTKESKVVIDTKSGKTIFEITLDKNIKKIEKGTDLATVFNIRIIYFDLDKWNIRPDAATDIAKVIEVMKQYPAMKIAIASHTDSRAKHKYNESLSQRRATSTLEYMVSSGIERSRLTAKGYGETQLVNNCADGVECTETEHQANRRSQFVISEM